MTIPFVQEIGRASFSSVCTVTFLLFLASSVTTVSLCRSTSGSATLVLAGRGTPGIQVWIVPSTAYRPAGRRTVLLLPIRSKSSWPVPSGTHITLASRSSAGAAPFWSISFVVRS